jgi:hypothetical protein
MKRIKIIHWIFTGLFSIMLLMGASMYIMKHEEMELNFAALGFPTWLIYPMATAKILGVVAILTKFKKFIVEWAYAGFLFNLLLAIGAHAAVGESITGVLMPLAFWAVSYITWKMAWKEA